MSGLIALHGGGEYVAGDEAAMDALMAAALEASAGAAPTVVIVPTAAARQRPDLAAAHGERAFRAAAARAGTDVHVGSAPILAREDAEVPDRAVTDLLGRAHLVHLPGGDPELIPTVFRSTPAWSLILRALDRGACLAGASAGAMALAERLWAPAGPMDGLGLLAGLAVLPHFTPGTLAWRTAVEGDDRRLAWLGLDEQTLVIGRPSGTWRVAGRGRAHLVLPGPGSATASSGPGELMILG